MIYHITALAADKRAVDLMRAHLFLRGIMPHRLHVDAGGRDHGDDPEILVTVETEDHERVQGIEDALESGGGKAVSCIEESAAHDAV